MFEQATRAWIRAVGAERLLSVLSELVCTRAIVGFDQEGKVRLWNSEAERLTGLHLSEVLGKGLDTLGLSLELAPGKQADLSSLTQSASLQFRTIQHPQGHFIRVHVSAQVLAPDTSGQAARLEVWEVVDSDSMATYPKSSGAWATITEFHGLITQDKAMLSLFDSCKRVARSAAPVLVRGESGTGKELIARALHAESERAARPFVAINCAALSPSLLESELFGHVKGAFTGALREREGIFRRAHGGTLFLDEIAELPLELQAKLLRVLEANEVTPVGSERAFPIDVRVVAATHRSLRAQVAAGFFREDLMFRLRVVPLFLPPLRERGQDWDMLLWHFLSTPKASSQREVKTLSHPAYTALKAYSWPGNVRELRNVADYVLALGHGPEVTLSELPPEIQLAYQGATFPLKVDLPVQSSSLVPELAPLSPLEVSEREALAEALARYPHSLSEVAKHLQMSRATLWRKRRRYGL